MGEALYKDDPGLSDVHVPGPAALYLPAASGKKPKDVVLEAEANQRNAGTPAPKLAKGFSTFFKVSGVNEELGLVFGWGLICKEGGADYYDSQANHVPEDAMVEATTDFMKNSRMAGEQHARMEAGTVVHSFPLTSEIWKAMFSTPDGKMLGGLPEAPPKSGWMVAMAPDAEMLDGFKSGRLTGFSIGGEHLEIDGKPVGEPH